MPTLWFKQCYVAPILAGDKTSTVRRGHQDWPIGERVALAIGPRHLFAHVEIVGCAHLRRDELSVSEAEAVASLYPDAEQFTRLHFRLLP